MQYLADLRLGVIQSNGGSAQLLPGTGEFEAVMSGGGDQALRFTYTPDAGETFDLSSALALFSTPALPVEVWFSAYQGGIVRVVVEDESGATWASNPTSAFFVGSGYLAPIYAQGPPPVDLEHIVRVEVAVENMSSGSYAVSVMHMPYGNGDLVQDFSVVPTTLDPPHPTAPVTLHACRPGVTGCASTLDVDLSLQEVSLYGHGFGADTDVGLVSSSARDVVSVTSVVHQGNTSSSSYRTVYRLELLPPEPGAAAPVQSPPQLDWTSGQDYAQVTIPVTVDGGVQTLTLFFEPQPGRPLSFASAVALDADTTLITVDAHGSSTDYTSWRSITIGGSFEVPPVIPALAVWPRVALAILLALSSGAALRRRWK